MADIALHQPAVPGIRVPFDERRERLAEEITRQLEFGNRRLESQSDLSAVVIVGKPVNHLLHLAATVLTVGIWSLVWLLLVLTGGEKRDLVRVDQAGNVSVDRLAA